MNKRLTTITIIVLLLVLAGYIVIDILLKEKAVPVASSGSEVKAVNDSWTIYRVFKPDKGQLNSVTVSDKGIIILGGETFIAAYDTSFRLIWEYKTEMPVTAVAMSGKYTYAAVEGTLLIFDENGSKLEEWGPFENNSMITSVAANDSYVAFADAANKTVFVLDKKGNLKSIFGKSGDPFIIPSYYFDTALNSENILYIANTGYKRIESWSIDGTRIGYFGKSGTDPDSFCGCCNPSHFALIPGGFITAEKGINRIKVLNHAGEFVEFVSSVNEFVPPLPLDIASADGKTIYGANPADSKLYVFRRK